MVFLPHGMSDVLVSISRVSILWGGLAFAVWKGVSWGNFGGAWRDTFLVMCNGAAVLESGS